jgi:hypothetical protein
MDVSKINQTNIPPRNLILNTRMPSKRTTDLKMPIKSDTTRDKRYSYPQFTKSDGKRDMRTTASHKKTN